MLRCLEKQPERRYASVWDLLGALESAMSPVATGKPPAARRDRQVIRDFSAEVRTTMRFDHPNVIEVLDYDMSAQPPYFTMEYVDGSNLRDVLAGEPERLRKHFKAVVLQTAGGGDHRLE